MKRSGKPKQVCVNERLLHSPVGRVSHANHAKTLFDLLLFLADHAHCQIADEWRKCENEVNRCKHLDELEV